MSATNTVDRRLRNMWVRRGAVRELQRSAVAPKLSQERGDFRAYAVGGCRGLRSVADMASAWSSPGDALGLACLWHCARRAFSMHIEILKGSSEAPP